MMGTRCGDIDPSVYYYLATCTGKSSEEIYDILNKKSGFLGVSGLSNDTRDILAAAEKGDERCINALKLWARRVADFVGSYYVRLGGADMLIFSAGITENNPICRKMILDDISEALDIHIDWAKNDELIGKEGEISTPDSKIRVAVIPTDEEVMIARDCYSALEGTL